MGTWSYDACPGRVHCVACEVIFSSFQCRDIHLCGVAPIIAVGKLKQGVALVKSTIQDFLRSCRGGEVRERSNPRSPRKDVHRAHALNAGPPSSGMPLSCPAAPFRLALNDRNMPLLLYVPTCMVAIPQKKLQGAGSHDLSMKMPEYWQLIAAAGKGVIMMAAHLLAGLTSHPFSKAREPSSLFNEGPAAKVPFRPKVL